MIQGQDSPEPDQLLATLEKWVCRISTEDWAGELSWGSPGPGPLHSDSFSPRQETIEQLLSNMFEGEQCQSVIVSGIQVLLTLLEPRRPR